MPKQVLKINRFDGGFNDKSDPRDIAQNELVSATGISISNPGQIVMAGAPVAGSGNSGIPSAIPEHNAGYGLFFFKHDKAGGNVYTYLTTHFLVDGTNSTTQNDFDKGGVDMAWPVDGLIDATLWNSTDGVIANAVNITDNDANSITSVAHLTWNDGDKGHIVAWPDEPSNYMCLMDSDGDAWACIYRETVAGVDKGWGQNVVDLGNTTGVKAVYHYVDGTLRVADANFGSGNIPRWWGYVDRWFFGDGSSGVTHDLSNNYHHTNGTQVKRWWMTSQYPEALEVKSGVTSTSEVFAKGGFNNASSEQDESNSVDPPSSGIGLLVEFHGGEVHSCIDGSSNVEIPSVRSTVSDDQTVIPSDINIVKMSVFLSDALEDGGDNAVNCIYPLKADSTASTSSGTLSDFDWIGATGDTDAKFGNMFIVGDYIYLTNRSGTLAAGAGNNNNLLHAENHGVYKVARVTENFGGGQGKSVLELDRVPPQIVNMAFGSNTDGDLANGEVHICNLSRMNLWDNTHENPSTGQTSTLNGGGSFPVHDQKYYLGITTLYDDSKQESVIREVGYIDAYNAAGYMDKIRFHFHARADQGDGLHDKVGRVSGFKIYMKRSDESTWYKQAEIDITKGLANWNTPDDYDMWDSSLVDTNNAVCGKNGNWITKWNTVDTYETETGISSSYPQIGFDSNGTGYKTAVVTNRRSYIANVKIKDKSGNVQALPDTMLKSPVNKFDMITLDNRIDVTIQDGDEIVKLEEYADRILQFKTQKLHIINVSQDIEFLEDTFQHKGVYVPAAVCKTDMGIAWVNNLGVYMYDGQRVYNLMEKNNVKVLSDSTISTYLTTTSIIGYSPKERQLFIVTDSTTDGTGLGLCYDITTKGWTKLAGFGADAITNMVPDWNQELTWGSGSSGNTSSKWSSTSSDQTIEIITKDIDFDFPSQRKKIYKVYITYQSGSSVPTLTSGVNGDASPDDTVVSGSFSTGQSSWARAEFKLHVNTKTCYSVQLKIAGSTHADFKINDISIVYRKKGTK